MRIFLIFFFVCSFSFGQTIIVNRDVRFAEGDPYTVGTNEFPTMVGNVDSPDSSVEWPGGWTLNGSGSWSVESTTVKNGTTSLDISGTSVNDGVTSFGWDPTGQGAGVDWRWEGYVYVPTGTVSASLAISDTTTGETTYDILSAPEHTLDQWVWFSFDHSQGSTNTFTMRIRVNGTIYLDGMKWINITP